MTVVDELLRGPKTGLHIGGEWEEGISELDVIDPATEQVLAAVSTAGHDHARSAVDAAAEAAPGWAATAPRVRSEILRRSYETMLAREEQLAELIVLENGKTYADALGEVRYAAEFFRWFSEEAVRIIGEFRTAPAGDKRIIVAPEPVGISLMVTPWNFPSAMATRKLGPALAAGCTTILKPASDTPLSALAVADILADAGLPPGVVNVVTARGSSGVVDTILEDPRVRKLSFTGSTEVGQLLMAKAGSRIMRTSMELGGNAPFVVFDDADLDAAIEGAMLAKMRNAGETCVAANRFYVQAGVSEVFTSRLTEAMSVLRMGPGIDRSNQVGPMINAQAIEKIDWLVSGAVDGDATVRTGGRAPDGPGYFYEPTVLSEVSPDSTILDHEIFGPVAPVVSFDTEEEVVGAANDTVHGLISYVYTSDINRGFRMAEAIESGMVALNRGLISDPAAPFGGVKQSGIGREGSHHGMEEYLELKYVAW
ncbi:MAG: NAD-dependent succinate-semialdehyde dehydrogenase [bacterium]|nr:NAD-dependent succinate-semialdehyde dehydrogenase [bacterium]MDE0290184.1 NAD-dependent succinate-semialdehyde dehydrogenase [bacterium]MDE0440015.1 NAD-dependent succinate-semialdehyde dehydrogenase [bacterium]